MGSSGFVLRQACRGWLAALVMAIAASRGVVAQEVVLDDLFQPLDYGTVASDAPRFYVSGIVGSSWATLTTTDPVGTPIPSAVDPIFTAGGALGMAFERTAGRIRLEAEGRGHGTLGLGYADATKTASIRATDTWSAMLNLWRDVDLTQKLSVYAGGGVGGGGYQLDFLATVPASSASYAANGAVTAFAWQAGCGVNYALTEKITLDLGYRFFAIDSGSIAVVEAPGGNVGRLGNGFSASEIMLGVRIYEPFRNWRR